MSKKIDKNTTFPPVDVAVIGAGMAGLSTAVYARRSGLSVRVFEKHLIPGGLCTSWKRKGHVFDYCVHYFFGTSKEHAFYDMWKDLGIIDAVEFQQMDSFGCYKSSDGQILHLYTDYRRLQEHLCAIAPEDTKKIKEFCKAIRAAHHMMIVEFSLSPRNLVRLIRSIPALPVVKKWSRIFTREWSATLKSPLLGKVIPPLIGMVDFPLVGPIMVFALMNRGAIAYPLGGSLPLALAVEKQAKSLGAEFNYRTGVKRVIIEEGRAVGIELEDGRIQRAHNVVAACDLRTTFDSLLEGQIKDPIYEKMFKKNEIHPGIIQVSLGVKIDPAWNLEAMPRWMLLQLKNTISIDKHPQSNIGIYQHTNDPGMAPQGNTVILVRYKGDYDRWKKLHNDREKYKAEKKRVLTDTIQALEEHFPGISKRIEASDVATPTTCVRYTGNWQGSMQGWILTKELMKKIFTKERPPKTFSGLHNFYQIGQWTEPNGGLPPAAKNGQNIIRAIIKEVRKKNGPR